LKQAILTAKESSTTLWHSEKQKMMYRGSDHGRDQKSFMGHAAAAANRIPGQEPISVLHEFRDDKNFVVAIEKADARRFSLPAFDGVSGCVSDGAGDS
jgi:hypothetical protein